MITLADPRRYGERTASHLLNRLSGPELDATLSELLQGGRDGEIEAALHAASSQVEYARLWAAVCDVAHCTRDSADKDELLARVFALPVVIVTGSRRPITLPGVVPDVSAITALFEHHGALGPSRNFGLGNALCSLSTIESVQPSTVYAWTRAADDGPRELSPSEISVTQPGEEVHLRLIVGAAISSSRAPSFVETASNISAWGVPLTRALGMQLQQAGADILPLARPPCDLLRSAHAGRSAQLDAALHLFMSNAVRRLRAASGDPVAVISTHQDNDVRVSLSSQFDDTALEGFRWPLHALDDLACIAASIEQLMRECRINNVRAIAQVLSAASAGGQTTFINVRDAEALDRTETQH
jgi:hypothetical protein